MDPLSVGVLAGVGIVSGFLAGFLGIGGGVVVIPALVYVVGIDMRLATGISMVLALFAAFSGLLAHHRGGRVDVGLGVPLGFAAVIGALIGSFGSVHVPERTLLVIYFCLVGIAILLLLFAPGEEAQATTVSPLLAIPIGLVVGVLAGLLGVGGGFILTPLMITLLRVPTRVAVGTSLLVILPTTIAGTVGKVATGQFDLAIGSVVVIGGILGAQVGARASTRVSPRVIHITLFALLATILARTAIDLLSGGL